MQINRPRLQSKRPLPTQSDLTRFILSCLYQFAKFYTKSFELFFCIYIYIIGSPLPLHSPFENLATGLRCHPVLGGSADLFSIPLAPSSALVSSPQDHCPPAAGGAPGLTFPGWTEAHARAAASSAGSIHARIVHRTCAIIHPVVVAC